MSRLQIKDSNSDFVKITKFESHFTVIRRHGASYRRILIRANDGSIHPFIIQNPSGRAARREEKLMQMFRVLNVILKKKKGTSSRGSTFNMPAIIPLSSHVRMIQDESSQVTLEEVYEDYCLQSNLHPDDVIMYYKNFLKRGIEKFELTAKKSPTDILSLKLDAFDDVCKNIIPNDVLSKVCIINLLIFQYFSYLVFSKYNEFVK